MNTKLKKKYYLPGVISLLGIPLMLCYFINRQINSRLYVIPIDWYNKQHWDTTNNNIGKLLAPERKYLKLMLNHNKDSNNVIFNLGEMLIRKIMTDRDTINAVNFVFQNDCKLETVVSALNICLVNKVPCYFLSHDGLVVYYVTPYALDTFTQHQQPSISCGTMPPL